MPPVRRLTAIPAADVAGYSRLMGVDEEDTHERLKAHLGELINPKISQHRGRTVKNTGDGLLAEFASVVDAVRCAAEIQRGMLDREPDMPEERRIRLRIGVNLGDVNDPDGYHLRPLNMPRHTGVSSSDLLRMRRNRLADRSKRSTPLCDRGLQIFQGCGPHGAAWGSFT
jgi:hypothetical protein